MELNNEKLGRLVKTAEMYYEQNMTQSQIATQLGVSRPLVCRMLNEARTYGIVTIKINSFDEDNPLLSNQMCNIFGLKSVTIVPKDMSGKYTNDKISQYAANDIINYSKSVINYLGIGWGHLLDNITNQIQNKSHSHSMDISICPLIGSTLLPNHDFNINGIVQKLALSISAKPMYLYAPAFLESEQDMNLYKETENYKLLADCWKKLDVAVLGLSNYPTVPDFASSARYDDLLLKKKAVGNFLGYYYNIDGEVIRSQSDYAVQIPIENIANSRSVVGVCPHDISIVSVLGALNTGLFTHIVGPENIFQQTLSLKKSRI